LVLKIFYTLISLLTLTKSPWEEVRREMTEEKGLDSAVADKIGEFVQPTPSTHGVDGVAPSVTTKEDPRAVLKRLQASESLNSNPAAKKGLEELALLFDYLEVWGVLDEISLDMSLARGLDYYTGLIYEVVTEGSAPKSTTKPHGKKSKSSGDPDEDRSSDHSIGVGSVAAGGRYDDLVGMFSKKGQIPCVGISFGIDRIFGITKARMEKEANGAAVMRTNEVDVYIMAFGGDGCLPARMQIAQQLWDGKIKAEFMWKKKPKLPPQFKAAESAGVPLAVIVGEDELKQGMVKIKVMGAKEGDPEKEGVLVKRDELVEEVRKRLGNVESVLTKKVEEVKLEG
jgi:histidyl-tRNA synthetase